jgi:undecaprenyl-diphosphatase
MGWQDAGLAFDAALHTGTLLALLVYFWRDWIDLFRPILRSKAHVANPHLGRGLLWGIIIGCIPAGIAGFLVNDRLDAIETNPALNTTVMIVVSIALIVAGIVLYLADKYGGTSKRKLSQMTFFDYIAIGFAQAVALVWGVSRSGATISAGRLCSLDRDAAARFSFLLSTPIFMAVAAFHAKDVFEQGIKAGELAPSIAGIISATIVGLLAIRFLLGYVRRHNLNLFAWYRIALGSIILTLIATKIV